MKEVPFIEYKYHLSRSKEELNAESWSLVLIGIQWQSGKTEEVAGCIKDLVKLYLLRRASKGLVAFVLEDSVKDDNDILDGGEAVPKLFPEAGL